MNIARLSVRNPVFANLLLLVLLVGGITSYHLMPREVFPEIPLDMVVISTDFIGAPPEEVEKQVTIPIENAMEAVENIESIASQSYENISVMEIKIRQGTKDLQKMVNDIKDEIDKIEHFPDSAKKPQVLLIESEIPLINVSVAGTAPESVRRKVADELKNRLLRIQGVARVQTSGFRDIEIWAETDPLRAGAMKITLDRISGAIAAANVNIPAGQMESAKHDFPLRTTSELKTAGDVAQVVIYRDSTGRQVRVRDVANVAERFEKKRTLGRVDGENSVSLLVMKAHGGSTISIVNQVREVIDKFHTELPGSIRIKTSQDSSRYIRQRLKTLYRSGTIGLIFVCAVLFLFLNWRMAFWTALGIPAAFAGTLMIMDYIGISINMMSLFAMILVLGMVVDDAIIVTENVFRYLQAGLKPERAAVVGASQVFKPVIAATTTTVAAFTPMLMMTGIMGKFISNIPIVVTITLLVSLVEAFFILPSHLADFAKPGKERMKKERGWFRKVRKRYRSLIKLFLRYRYRVLAIVLAVFLGTLYYAVYHMKFVLFNSKDLVGFIVKVEMPVGASLEETGKMLRKVEKMADSLPKQDIKATVSMAGMTLNYQNGRVQFGQNLGQTLFESTEFDTPGRRNAFIVMNEVREKVKLLTGMRTVEVTKLGGGPPLGHALEARISGTSYPTIREIAREMEDYLKTIPGVKDIRDDFVPGKSEIRVIPDPTKLSLYGLTERDIASSVRTAFDGLVATTIRRGRDDIDVRLIFAKPYRDDLNFIPQILLTSPSGKQVRLSSVADIKWQTGLSTINRFNRKRTIKVFADVNNDIITSSELSGIVKKHFRNISRDYPGSSLDFGGETAEQRKSVVSLVKASLIGILVIYLILGTLFKSFMQPVVVIMAIPFSYIGVVVGHELMGEPIGMLSLIGLAALTGIVVNDSLVMVDFINGSRINGAGRWLSILRSAFVRFRAVILTSLTTILGLSTLAFRTTGQAAFLAPMAISIVFGLVFSTILTLLVIPCLYAALDDLMIKIYGKEGIVFRERDV